MELNPLSNFAWAITSCTSSIFHCHPVKMLPKNVFRKRGLASEKKYSGIVYCVWENKFRKLLDGGRK